MEGLKMGGDSEFSGLSNVIPRRAREEGDGTRDGVEKHGL